MQKFFLYILRWKWAAALLALVVIAFVIIKLQTTDTPTIVSAKVERGTVEQLVSVSGTVKLTNTAELSFPQTGTVARVLVNEGDVVTQGQVLASLEVGKLDADLHDASAYIAIQTANRDELVRGPSVAERAITTADVLAAKDTLARITREQDSLIKNARRILFSTDLVATPTDPNNTDAPPAITGSYTCTNEGAYAFKTYPSGSNGFSYQLSGLETSATKKAETASAQPLGTCGLYIQFVEGAAYGSEEWKVSVPNKRSSSYVANLNAYELAVEKRKSAIADAEEAYAQAQLDETEKNGVPREEALTRANATVAQGRARYEALQAERVNRTIVAPFAGVVSKVTLTTGESSGAGSITLVSDKGFELSVRIPEIDITKITLGETARVLLDARPGEALTARVGFISPVATEIDGVSYYEALLYFEQSPEWLRGGFNADVDIVTSSVHDVLRIPLRFVSQEDTGAEVTFMNGKERETRVIQTGLQGTDGFIEVTNLPEGFEIIAP